MQFNVKYMPNLNTENKIKNNTEFPFTVRFLSPQYHLICLSCRLVEDSGCSTDNCLTSSCSNSTDYDCSASNYCCSNCDLNLNCCYSNSNFLPNYSGYYYCFAINYYCASCSGSSCCCWILTNCCCYSNSNYHSNCYSNCDSNSNYCCLTANNSEEHDVLPNCYSGYYLAG